MKAYLLFQTRTDCHPEFLSLHESTAAAKKTADALMLMEESGNCYWEGPWKKDRFEEGAYIRVYSGYEMDYVGELGFLITTEDLPDE